MEDKLSKIYEAADYLKSRLDGRVPVVGIILGSGLGKLGDKIEDPIVIPYKEIPNFAISTAIGHKGNFIAGMLGGKFVCAMLILDKRAKTGKYYEYHKSSLK